MHIQRIFVLAGVTTLLAAGALAQSDSDYQMWMKTNIATAQALPKDIAAKDGKAVSADGQKLDGILKQVEDFWQKRNVPDAVNFAKQAQLAAEAISKAGDAGNLDQATAEIKNLQANCMGCHMAHRERTPEGTFKIK
jgi:hypothetical protein